MGNGRVALATHDQTLGLPLLGTCSDSGTCDGLGLSPVALLAHSFLTDLSRVVKAVMVVMPPLTRLRCSPVFDRNKTYIDKSIN